MVKCLGGCSAMVPMGLPSRSSKLQVLSSPVRLTVISIVGSLQKEAAPVKERPKSRRNAQGGHFCLAIRLPSSRFKPAPKRRTRTRRHHFACKVFQATAGRAGASVAVKSSRKSTSPAASEGHLPDERP